MTAENEQTALTTAQELGQTVHPSALIQKVKLLIGDEDVVPCLKQVAVERGCRHYLGAFTPPRHVPPKLAQLTDEELAIALCVGELTYDPTNIRIAAEMLSATTCNIKRLAELATEEHCENIVGYIAKCGQRVEPNTAAWQEILNRIGRITDPPPGVLPHWTRFVSATGITPRGGGPHVQWLRPRHT